MPISSTKITQKPKEQVKTNQIKKIDFLPEPIYKNDQYLKPENLEQKLDLTTPKKNHAEEMNYNSPSKSRGKSLSKSRQKRLKSCLKTPSPCKKRAQSSKKKHNVSFRSVAMTSDNKF